MSRPKATNPKLDSPLRRIRLARTIDQTHLANIVGVTQESISKAERGKMHFTRDVQERIAAVLGVARHELFPEAR